MYHHTRDWTEPAAHDGGPSYADMIQEAAKDVADTIERLQKENDRLRKEFEAEETQHAKTWQERDAARAEVERLKGERDDAQNAKGEALVKLACARIDLEKSDTGLANACRQRDAARAEAKRFAKSHLKRMEAVSEGKVPGMPK